MSDQVPERPPNKNLVSLADEVLSGQSGHTGFGSSVGAIAFFVVVLLTYPKVDYYLGGICFIMAACVVWGITYSMSFTLNGLDKKLDKINKLRKKHDLRKEEVAYLKRVVIREHGNNRTRRRK